MLKTPAPQDVADYLVAAEGVDAESALFAAHASQGHVGRARALARDERTSSPTRHPVDPGPLEQLANALTSAEAMVTTARKMPARSPNRSTSEREPAACMGRRR